MSDDLVLEKQRFEKFVEKTDNCWLWTGCKQGTYPVFWYRGRQILSHKLAYMFYNGEIPLGLIIRHKCKSKLCVNPTHLETGTYKQNSMDRFRDGTINNKVTAEQVLAIRASDKTQKELAQLYNVTTSNINYILKRRSWNHI
jgi:hypothetical protein